MKTVSAVALHARCARGDVERALDTLAVGGRWPWHPRLSAWLDALLIIEEGGR